MPKIIYQNGVFFDYTEERIGKPLSDKIAVVVNNINLFDGPLLTVIGTPSKGKPTDITFNGAGDIGMVLDYLESSSFGELVKLAKLVAGPVKGYTGIEMTTKYKAIIKNKLGAGIVAPAQADEDKTQQPKQIPSTAILMTSPSLGEFWFALDEGAEQVRLNHPSEVVISESDWNVIEGLPKDDIATIFMIKREMGSDHPLKKAAPFVLRSPGTDPNIDALEREQAQREQARLDRIEMWKDFMVQEGGQLYEIRLRHKGPVYLRTSRPEMIAQSFAGDVRGYEGFAEVAQ
jgi:hypothetical protein